MILGPPMRKCECELCKYKPERDKDHNLIISYKLIKKWWHQFTEIPKGEGRKNFIDRFDFIDVLKNYIHLRNLLKKIIEKQPDGSSIIDWARTGASELLPHDSEFDAFDEWITSVDNHIKSLLK